MERNLTLYPLFHLTRAGFFWLPVFFLFFTERVGVADALRLQSIYYLSFVLLEVPSGYASDLLGRRVTLLCSSSLGVLAGLCFYFGADLGSAFLWLAIAQVLLAAWHAFHSGTDTALLFDTLQELGREEEFGKRAARAETWGRVVVGATAFIGGALASTSLSLGFPYLLFAGSALLTLVVVFFFKEPVHERASAPLAQAKNVVAALSDGTLLWCFAFAVGGIVINHIPYELFQPYLDLLLAERFGIEERPTPFVAGLVMMVNMWVAAVGTRFSVELGDRFGRVRVLLAALLFQVMIIAAMSALLHPVVGALLAMRSLSPGISSTLLQQISQPRLKSGMRATFTSLQSLIGRSLHGGLMFGVSFYFELDPLSFGQLRPVLVVGAAGSALFLLILVLARPRARDRSVG